MLSEESGEGSRRVVELLAVEADEHGGFQPAAGFRLQVVWGRGGRGAGEGNTRSVSVLRMYFYIIIGGSREAQRK